MTSAQGRSARSGGSGSLPETGPIARLRRSDLATHVDVPAAFDPADDEHLNQVAGDLLRLFREGDDVEAYTFLVELLHPRLLAMAGGIARRQGVLLDPDDLVAGFMARLFTDVRKDQPVVKQFLALAYTTMRYDALNQLRLHRRARTRGEAWEQMRVTQLTPVDPAWAVDEAERTAQGLHVAATFLSIVGHCFHGLGDRDRRVLSLRELEGLSYDDLAVTLEVPRTQVGMVLKRARARLARRVESTLRRTPAPARPSTVAASTPS